MEKSLPSDKLTISNDRELFMSYGMFNDIMRILGTPDDVAFIMINDASTRDLVMRRLFTDKSIMMKEESDLIGTHELELTHRDVTDIVAWVTDHATYFLVSTGQQLKPVLEKYRPAETNENPSSDQLKTGSKS